MATAEIRPMSAGEILDRTFALYRSHFWVFVGIMAVPQLVVLAVNMIPQILQGFRLFAQGGGAASPPSSGLLVGVIMGALLVFLILLFVFYAMYALAQAATIFAVSEIYLGRQITARDAYRRVRGKLSQILGVMFSMGIRVGLGFLLLVIPGLLLMLRYCVAMPAAMLEDLHSREALDRSTELTEGRRGEAFLFFLLFLILGWVGAAIFTFPVGLAAAAYSKNPAILQLLTILEHVGGFLSGVLVGPLATIAFSLFYYDTRVRKEALDLQLMMAALDGKVAPPAPSKATLFGS